MRYGKYPYCILRVFPLKYICNAIQKENLMEKRQFAILALTLCTLTACFSPSKPDKLEQAVEQIAQALDTGYEKQSATEVYRFHYSDGNGGRIVYHLCLTTYYAADPESVIGLDTDAISAVLDLENTPAEKELEVNGKPAVICQKDARTYLCWTISPEVSAILEYSPEAVSEEEALRIAQSVRESQAE